MEQIADLLGLWSDRQRASREVKALAQGHLDALEQKMRELAEMQQALRRLVDSCHGDDDPHCAILEELSVDSPQAPEPGAVGAKPARRSAAKSSQPARAARPGLSGHVDLMAWTRNIHTRSEPH